MLLEVKSIWHEHYATHLKSRVLSWGRSVSTQSNPAPLVRNRSNRSPRALDETVFSMPGISRSSISSVRTWMLTTCPSLFHPVYADGVRHVQTATSQSPKCATLHVASRGQCASNLLRCDPRNKYNYKLEIFHLRLDICQN